MSGLQAKPERVSFSFQEPEAYVKQVGRFGFMKWEAGVNLGLCHRYGYTWTLRGAERKARRILARELRERTWTERRVQP